MANYTKNLGLELPEKNEFYSIDKINANSEKIDAVAHNENLLDNPWFTVNQRGVTTSWTGGNYGADRWKADGDSVSLVNSSVVMGADSIIYQRFESVAHMTHRPITFSLRFDGEDTIRTGTVSKFEDVLTKFYEDEYVRLSYNPDTKRFCINSKKVCTLKCAKVEIGSVSTLANDSAPNYATELLKCQRYFVKRRIILIGNDIGYATVFLPIDMISVPAVTVSSGAVYGYAIRNSSFYITGISAHYSNDITFTATADL